MPSNAKINRHYRRSRRWEVYCLIRGGVPNLGWYGTRPLEVVIAEMAKRGVFNVGP